MSSKIKPTKLSNRNSRTVRNNRTARRTSSSNNKTLTKKGFQGVRAIANIDLNNLVKNFNKNNGNYLGSGNYGDVFFLRDKHGNENRNYAVKFVRSNIGARLEAQFVKFLKRTRLAPMKGYAHNFDENFRFLIPFWIAK